MSLGSRGLDEGSRDPRLTEDGEGVMGSCVHGGEKRRQVSLGSWGFDDGSRDPSSRRLDGGSGPSRGLDRGSGNHVFTGVR